MNQNIRESDAAALFAQYFGGSTDVRVVSVPGRVNLIGEHIDYHDLPVLPMAIERGLSIAFRPSQESRVRAISAGYERREFKLDADLTAGAPGDWGNYVTAAARAPGPQWPLRAGIDAAVVSDLPPAAGLSSSSALLTAFTLALLSANGHAPTFEELMEVLPEAEHFVGTRGGGMDHAVILGARAGCALLLNFSPLTAAPIRIPEGWAFLVAHSLETAEKSSAVKAEYNARRQAGSSAAARLGFRSCRHALDTVEFDPLQRRARENLSGDELRCFMHVAGEAFRVRAAVSALKSDDATQFGGLLFESHRSLSQDLRVSTPALDRLVELSAEAGALGARLTGAGFGGCTIVLAEMTRIDRVRSELIERFYRHQQGFNPDMHLIRVQPAPGALFA